jgi:alkylhydroperoxidase family enzyme
MTRISGKDTAEIRQKMPKEIFAASMEMYKALYRYGKLDTRLRELVRLKSADLVGCKHWLRIRFAEAREKGIGEQEISEIDDLSSKNISARERLALSFTETLLIAPSSMTDEGFAEMREEFSEGEIVELSFFAGFYNMLHRFNSIIDLDPQAGSDLVEHRLSDFQMSD